MAKTIIDTTKEQKQKFEEYVAYKLQEEFSNQIYEKGETQAKLDILNNKDFIIDYVIDTIKKNVPLSFKYYWQYSSPTETILTINDIYIKIYNDTFKAYKVKQKAEKEYYKQVIYDTITKDIKNALEYQDIENVLINIKTIEYKDMLFKDLKKEYKDLSIDIYNNIYTQTLNNVISNYKGNLAIYKQQKKEIKQEQKGIKIPLGWKLAFITKAINKMVK